MLLLHSSIVSFGAVNKVVNNFSKMNKMMILKTRNVPREFSPRKKKISEKENPLGEIQLRVKATKTALKVFFDESIVILL